MKKVLAALVVAGLMAASVGAQDFIRFYPAQGGGSFTSPGAGIPVDTDGASTWAARCLAAGAGVSVANACGAAGNFTIGIDTAVGFLRAEGTADPPATCTARVDWYDEIDTNERYYCYATNLWALVSTNLTGGAFDPGTTINFWSEFESYTNGTSIPTEFTTETVFAAGGASEGGNCPDIGALEASCFGIINPALDNGGSVFRAFAWNNFLGGEWEMDVRFAVSSVTSMGIWIGAIFDATAGSRNPLQASDAVWMRFDTDASDTNFTFQVCDAAGAAGCQDTNDGTNSQVVAGTVAAAATTWFRFRMRLDQTGVGGNPTLYMRVNSEAEKTFCSSGCDKTIAEAPASTVNMFPFISCGTRDATGAEVCYYDYFRLTGTR